MKGAGWTIYTTTTCRHTYFSVLSPAWVTRISVAYSFIIFSLFSLSLSVYWVLNVYLCHWEPPIRIAIVCLARKGAVLFFFSFGASFIPFPARPQCPLFPKATAMEICFRHTANYLRVITSLPVQGDNEWLIGHSLLCRCVLLLPLSIIATCLTGGDGWCCPFGQCTPANTPNTLVLYVLVSRSNLKHHQWR